MRIDDITGKQYGKLTAIKRVGSDKWGGSLWLCKCECGNEKVISCGHLKSGASQSCGCVRIERTKQANTRHSMTDTRLYRAWHHIKNRCTNPNVDGYKDYGGRGIKMCDEWQDFINFKEWALNNGYTDTLTIERIDVNGNYEPSNCKWATMKEQQNNKRNNHLVTYKGITKTIAEWSEEKGIKYGTLYARLTRYHWDVETALEV